MSQHDSTDSNSILVELIRAVTGTFTASQAKSLEMQSQSIDRLNTLIMSLNKLLELASAHPSRAHLLDKLIETLREEMRQHDSGCRQRSEEDICEHHDRMERYVDLKLKPFETELHTIKEGVGKAVTTVVDSSEKAKSTLEKIEKKANWILMGSGAIGILFPIVYGIVKYFGG